MTEFISYGKQWIEDEDIEAVVRTLKSDFLTQGPAIEAFEKKICEITGAKYCVAFCNATAALHSAVACFGFSAGDEGITSPITFLASANCLVYNGLKPVFADIDSVSYNIDPVEIRKRITPRTKVLIPVDFAGQAVDIDAIQAIAREHGLKVIEDAAHAIGSRYADGRSVGCCHKVDMTVFSFHPVKTITCGEGGAVTTNDLDLARSLQRFRSHGIVRDPATMSKNPGPWYYEMTELGFNFRITDMQAALGTSQLSKLDRFKARRREIVGEYNRFFGSIDGLTIPFEAEGLDSCFHLYVLKVDFERFGVTRAEFMTVLKERGVGTQVLYIPVHTQPYYQHTWGYRDGDYPEAERYYEQAISLPLYAKMDDSQLAHVINSVKEVLNL